MSANKKIRKIVTILSFGLVVLFLAGCGGSSSESDITPVSTTSFTAPLSFEGKVIARKSYEMSFPSPGLIEEMNVNLGDIVNAGDVLAILNSSNFESEIQIAEAALSLAEANLQQINGKLNATAGEKAVAEAQVEEAQINLAIAQSKLEETKIVSPINGIITQIYTDQYEYTFAGQAVLQLQETENKSIRLQMDEFDLIDVHVGDSIIATFDNLPDPEQKGVVASILPDDIIDQSGIYIVIVDLTGNAELIPAGITAEVIFNSSATGDN
ncbi:efflux RND transporter periplasmic adaptor subunit [bacterium]|nr:efflux RND transporter periplasmic adaptor subunit [bacterium]